MDTPKRRAVITRLREHIPDYPIMGIDNDNHIPAVLNEIHDGNFFLMVETSRFGQEWITMFDSPDNAVRAHFHQEYREDWTLEVIVDLVTGQLYDIEPTAVAIRVDRALPPPDPDEALTFDECEDAGVDPTLRSIGC